MFTVSLISLPADTLRRLADDGSPHPAGGGDARERGIALAVIGGAVLLALFFALAIA